MDPHQRLLTRLARPRDSKIVLLVLDGVGDLRNAEQPQTALEAAALPNLDALAARSSLGRVVPVANGITPGSGPGHLALFGYDTTRPEADIGRGVLEALGLGLEVPAGTVAARGNFATADADGLLTDRRAGRIPTAECERLCAALREALDAEPLPGGGKAEIHAGEAHRFVVLLHGDSLDPRLADTDPQRLGAAPLPARALDPAAAATAELVGELITRLERVLADEPKANRLLLRGFSSRPALDSLEELYKIRCGAFAGYPLYRGVAGACGMQVVPCAKRFGDLLPTVAESWNRFDFFFIHVKQTDQAGEDGNVEAKIAVLEEVDAALPGLLDLQPDVLAITGDHSTPSPMAAHSWHPVPLLVSAKNAFVDAAKSFDELSTLQGALGTFPARELMGSLLAHAGRLAKFGA